MKSFKSLFKRKTSVIGVDIGSSSIKIVQIRNDKGMSTLETYGSLAIGPYVDNGEIGMRANANEGQLHTVLSTLIEEAKITTNTAGVSIPFHSSLISLIDVPNLSDEKIAQLIPFETKRHIPVPIEDVSIDWFIIPKALLDSSNKSIFEEDVETIKDKINKRKVLLIAIHKHELMKHKNILNRTNLDVKFFEIEIFSTLRSSVYETKLPMLVIDIGARTSKFYAIEHGIVIKSYFINQGGQTITQSIMSSKNISFKEAEYEKRKSGFVNSDSQVKQSISLVTDDIFAEANNLIIDFEQKYNKSIAKIILTGGGSSMKGILEEARIKTKVDVEIANPFAKLKHPAILTDKLKENGAEFSVAVGAAMRALNG